MSDEALLAAQIICTLGATIIGGGALMWRYVETRAAAWRERLHTTRRVRRQRAAASPAPVAVPAMPPHGIDLTHEREASVARGRITLPLWLHLLNDQHDALPHLMIIGVTGSGKTTTALAVLSQRDGECIILTPKPDDHWGGLPVTTIDDDASYTTLADTFASLETEVKRRLVAAKRFQPIPTTLTIVCDDWPVLAKECRPVSTHMFKLVARLGRAMRIRLIVLSQSERVKTIGIEGEGDTLDNFAILTLTRQREAQLEWRGSTMTLDLDGVREAAHRSIPIERSWAPATSSSPSSTPENVAPAQQDAQSRRDVPVELVPGTPPITAEEALAISTLLGTMSPSDVAKRIGGGRGYGSAKAKVDLVCRMLGAESPRAADPPSRAQAA